MRYKLLDVRAAGGSPSPVHIPLQATFLVGGLGGISIFTMPYERNNLVNPSLLDSQEEERGENKAENGGIPQVSSFKKNKDSLAYLLFTGI